MLTVISGFSFTLLSFIIFRSSLSFNSVLNLPVFEFLKFLIAKIKSSRRCLQLFTPFFIPTLTINPAGPVLPSHTRARPSLLACKYGFSVHHFPVRTCRHWPGDHTLHITNIMFLCGPWVIAQPSINSKHLGTSTKRDKTFPKQARLCGTLRIASATYGAFLSAVQGANLIDVSVISI